MFWSIVLLIITGLTHVKAVSIDGRVLRTRADFYNPVLSANAYTGHVRENERLVQINPPLEASDADPSNSLNGQICGYELSLHKHDDDTTAETSSKIPFLLEYVNGHAVMKVRENIDKLDCEIRQTYRLFVRAYDCASNDQRRYSERSSLVITVDDTNELVPVFTHKNYLFKLHQNQNCSSCRVEATDDDCSNLNHRVCDYQIVTKNVPFAIDSNGSISITKALTDTKYEFDVIATDCYPKSAKDATKLTSEPARVTVKIVQSCKPSITDNNPTKLQIQSDHTHIFDTVHVNSCDETCAVEEIMGTVTLDTNGIASGCNLEQCASIDREYVLIPKDKDSSQIPQTGAITFDEVTGSSIVPKTNFSGQFSKDFNIRMWMKRADEGRQDKEHIFCSSDEKLKNRHHTALLVQNDRLKLLIRKGPLSSSEKSVYASEWIWTLPQVIDNQWHSYKLFVNYPSKVDLYIDDQLFVAGNDNFEVIEDFALSIIEGTKDTVFALGACWHGRVSRMVQPFHGQLSGLTIAQKEDAPRDNVCLRDCQQFLDMPDVQNESGFESISNTNRSVWILRADSSESYEQLLKHIVYRNTFEPIGPSGQRTVSIQTTVKCLGENYTYNLPLFTRRIAIDEVVPPTVIELKGDTDILTSNEMLSRGLYLFGDLSIYTDALNKDQVDISDCSINTSPDLTSSEHLSVPDQELDVFNLQKDLTQTGLILSGSASIDSYQSILQQMTYFVKDSVQQVDRTFSLVCEGTNGQVFTNEIRVRVYVEKQVAPPAPPAAVLSNNLFVSNDQIRDNTVDNEGSSPSTRNFTAWPVAVVVCVSVSLAGVLVLYLVVRIRSGGKQRHPLSGTGDDMHSQMEWEDDIGLNIIVNPLEEPKKSVQSMNNHHPKQTSPEYECTSSEEDNDGDSQNDYSSEDDDEDEDHDEDVYTKNQIHPKKHQHQLEWDDEVMEYEPKKV